MTFEMEGMHWDDGIGTMGSQMRAVWFTDPDGRHLNLSPVNCELGAPSTADTTTRCSGMLPIRSGNSLHPGTGIGEQ